MKNYYPVTLILLFLLTAHYAAPAQFYTQRNNYLRANSNWFFGTWGLKQYPPPAQQLETVLFMRIFRDTFHDDFYSKLDGTNFSNVIPVSDPNTGAFRFFATRNLIYNKNWLVMPNGSFSEDAFGMIDYRDMVPAFEKLTAVIPFLNDPDKYFFINSSKEPETGLTYSIIDMQADGGLGDVVADSKTTTLRVGTYPDVIYEVIDVVPGNNCDLWLLVTETGFEARKMNVLAFNITAAGINPSPVISSFDRQNTTDLSWDFHISPNRDMIAYFTYQFWTDGQFVSNARLHFLHFDADNGKARQGPEPPITIPLTQNAHGNFTPDNNYFLASYGEYGNSQASIHRYELDAYDYGYNDQVTHYPVDWPLVSSSLVHRTFPPAIYFQPYDKEVYFNVPAGLGVPCSHNSGLPLDIIGLSAVKVSSLKPADGPLWNKMVTGPEFKMSRFARFFTNCGVTYPFPPTDTLPSVYFDTVMCVDPGVTFSHTMLQAKEGFSNYIWNDGTTGAEKLITEPGKYWVYYQAPCNRRVDTFIYRYRVAEKLLPPDSIICDQRYPVTIKAGEAEDFLWDDRSADPERTITQPGTYWVQYHAVGCTEYDTITLKGKYCPCGVGLPNAFTPNGDGQNDRFRPVIAPGCVPSGYSFRVFNRWGQIVYSSFNEFDPGWDGTYKGGAADIGTYFYEVRFKSRFLDNDYIQKGEFTLIR